MKNKIEDLRNHLFATIEALQDEDSEMNVENARAINAVAQTIINSAKIEVDFLKITGGVEGSGFIPYEPREPLPPGRLELRKDKI